eukprot:COSAG02_NODE_10491_length_1930_cov_1.469143_1_plen_37_part_10
MGGAEQWNLEQMENELRVSGFCQHTPEPGTVLVSTIK